MHKQESKGGQKHNLCFCAKITIVLNLLDPGNYAETGSTDLKQKSDVESSVRSKLLQAGQKMVTGTLLSVLACRNYSPLRAVVKKSSKADLRLDSTLANEAGCVPRNWRAQRRSLR